MTFVWNEMSAPTEQELESAPVSVFVVSTRSDLLNSAVTAAKQLTRELGAQIEVLAPHGALSS